MNALAPYLHEHRLKALFIEELGWDHASGTHQIAVDGWSLCFDTLAHKRGVQVLWCSTDRVVLLNRNLLRQFQNRIARTVHEHILIFSCEVPRKQVWGWAIRLPDGRKRRHREHSFFSASPPEPFLDRLEQLRVSLDEEAGVQLVDVLDRVRGLLDSASELDLFAKRPWYATRSDELARAMRQGDGEAFHLFILLHLKLARKLSKRLQRWFEMAPEDAEQIAVLGMIEAARRFQPERGIQFSTYASWWIKQACQRHGPEMALLIRVPGNIFWMCFRHAIDLERLCMAGGLSSVRDSLTELELLNPWLAQRWRAYLRARNIDSLSDRLLLRQAQTIPDDSSEPIDRLLREDTIRQIRTAINRLPPRDAEVVRLRHGLDGQEWTLERIGQQMGLTKERIRQLQIRGEERLRDYLQEEGCLLSAASGDVEPTGPAFYYSPFSADALAPGLPIVAASQDTRTSIRNFPDRFRIEP